MPPVTKHFLGGGVEIVTAMLATIIVVIPPGEYITLPTITVSYSTGLRTSKHKRTFISFFVRKYLYLTECGKYLVVTV